MQELDSDPDCSFFFQLICPETQKNSSGAVGSPEDPEFKTSNLISPPDLLKTQFSVRYRLLNRDKENKEKIKEAGEEASDEDEQERVLTLTPDFKDYKVSQLKSIFLRHNT